ncbi:hypothetical protein [Thalassiella azotivora]
MNDDTVIWVVVAVAALLLVGLLVWFLTRKRTERRQQEHLRERFGDEYDRRVEESGDERAARRHLSQVEERREQVRIRDLAPAARERYLQRWQTVQADFVDRPGESVDAADALVVDLMRERGYPVDDMDTRADMVAADHPDVVRDYRAALDARHRHHDAGDEATTEELRRAMVHYRSLVERLVGDADTAGGAADSTSGGGRHQARTPDDPPAGGPTTDDGHPDDEHRDDEHRDDAHRDDARRDDAQSDPHRVDLTEHDTRAEHRTDER